MSWAKATEGCLLQETRVSCFLLLLLLLLSCCCVVFLLQRICIYGSLLFFVAAGKRYLPFVNKYTDEKLAGFSRATSDAISSMRSVVHSANPASAIAVNQIAKGVSRDASQLAHEVLAAHDQDKRYNHALNQAHTLQTHLMAAYAVLRENYRATSSKQLPIYTFTRLCRYGLDITSCIKNLELFKANYPKEAAAIPCLDALLVHGQMCCDDIASFSSISNISQHVR